MRDVFNSAETVNEWRPMSCYPVAVALAMARSRELGSEARQRRETLRILNSWCDDLEKSPSGPRQKPVYDEQCLERHIAVLEELGILRDERFTSELLQAWLEGVGYRSLLSDPEDRAALRMGAQILVRRPKALDPVTTGSQADIFQFRESGETFAWREIEIRSEPERERFLAVKDALGVLERGLHKREAGADFIFDLKNVGFVDGEPNVAAQVYRWVKGKDLADEESGIPPILAADIGRRMAVAIALIHRYGVIHRDIQPKNIILSDEDARPILIDFGLARLAERRWKTAISSEFTAPEVRGNDPEWSRSSDVYSLGATLRFLLDESASRYKPLQSLLDRCLAEAPEDRPSSESLLAAFERITERLKLDSRRSEIINELRSLAKVDSGVGWYGRMIDKHLDRLVSLLLGLHSDAIGRASDVADFLNQVLEAAPGPSLSLGKVKRKNEFTGRQLSVRGVETAHELRLYRSHGDRRRHRVLSKTGDSGQNGTIEDDLIEAAGAIGSYLGLSSLAPVVSKLLVRSE